eukprot:6492412-Amphidinium_carterae.2
MSWIACRALSGRVTPMPGRARISTASSRVSIHGPVAAIAHCKAETRHQQPTKVPPRTGLYRPSVASLSFMDLSNMLLTQFQARSSAEVLSREANAME